MIYFRPKDQWNHREGNICWHDSGAHDEISRIVLCDIRNESITTEILSREINMRRRYEQAVANYIFGFCDVIKITEMTHKDLLLVTRFCAMFWVIRQTKLCPHSFKLQLQQKLMILALEKFARLSFKILTALIKTQICISPKVLLDSII